MNCKDCKYARSRSVGTIECRFNPPPWVSVGEGDWCAKWELKPSSGNFAPAPYTPFLIEMMLVCYWSPYPHDQFGERWNSAVGELARNTLREQGLVNEDYRPTPKGERWVKRICRVPMDAPEIGSVPCVSGPARITWA